MASLVSRVLDFLYNGRPHVAQLDSVLTEHQSEQDKAEARGRDLMDRKQSCCGFVYACYHMCCMSRQFDLRLTSSVIMMLLAFYTNLAHSVIKICYEVVSTDRTYPRFMHGVELLVNMWIHRNYSIFSCLMKVGREEVKKRSDGQMHSSTKEKVLLVAESLYSCLHNLIMFSIITTLTRVDKDGVNGVSILCAGMLKLYHWSLIIPPRNFQGRHYLLFPFLATFENSNIHAVLHFVIMILALIMSMFVLYSKSPHTVIFWITVGFVANQFKMLITACQYNHDPNRGHAQDENIAVSTAVTQIYALILILRLDAMEHGLVLFYDELRSTFMS